MEFFSEAEVNVGKVDKNGDAGPIRLDRSLEFAVFAVDARQVANNLGNAHDGHIFRPNDLVESRIDHTRAAHADKICPVTERSELVAQLLDQHCAVVFAAGFSRGDEDGGVGQYVRLVPCLRKHDSGLSTERLRSSFANGRLCPMSTFGLVRMGFA